MRSEASDLQVPRPLAPTVGRCAKVLGRFAVWLVQLASTSGLL